MRWQCCWLFISLGSLVARTPKKARKPREGNCPRSSNSVSWVWSSLQKIHSLRRCGLCSLVLCVSPSLEWKVCEDKNQFVVFSFITLAVLGIHKHIINTCWSREIEEEGREGCREGGRKKGRCFWRVSSATMVWPIAHGFYMSSGLGHCQHPPPTSLPPHTPLLTIFLTQYRL